MSRFYRDTAGADPRRSSKQRDKSLGGRQAELRLWNSLEQIERKVRLAETKATEALGLHKTGIVATPNDPETIKKIKDLKLQADSAREKLLNFRYRDDPKRNEKVRSEMARVGHDERDKIKADDRRIYELEQKWRESDGSFAEKAKSYGEVDIYLGNKARDKKISDAAGGGEAGRIAVINARKKRMQAGGRANREAIFDALPDWAKGRGTSDEAFRKDWQKRSAELDKQGYRNPDADRTDEQVISHFNKNFDESLAAKRASDKASKEFKDFKNTAEYKEAAKERWSKRKSVINRPDYDWDSTFSKKPKYLQVFDKAERLSQASKAADKAWRARLSGHKTASDLTGYSWDQLSRMNPEQLKMARSKGEKGAVEKQNKFRSEWKEREKTKTISREEYKNRRALLDKEKKDFHERFDKDAELKEAK